MKNPHAVSLGRKGGQAKSKAKLKASRANGRNGGRPKKGTKTMIQINDDLGSYSIDPDAVVTDSYGDNDRCNDIVGMHSKDERDFLRVCEAAHAAMGKPEGFTFGEFEAACIGETEIAQWFESRNESPIARRGHTGILSSLFQFAWRKRYVPENPVRRIERVHLDRKIPCVLTLPQVRKVLTWTKRERPKWLGWLALALFCGMRPDAEADLITWTDIDLARGRIVITKSKVRAPRIVDLSFCPPALRWLKTAKRLKAPLGLSYPKRRDYVRKLRKVLGFKRWPQDVLRHTAASNLLAYHQDAGKVAEFLGNSAGVLLRDYKALIFKEDAEKWMELT